MRRTCWFLLATATATSLPATEARADGVAEVILGASMPRGDAGHDELVDTGLKLGVRGTWLFTLTHNRRYQLRGGPELALDHTFFAGEEDVTTLGRSRALAGARLGVQIGRGFLFGRAAAGVDRFEVDFLQPGVEQLCVPDATTVGPAIELGAGFGVRDGHLVLGVQATYTKGYHRDDRPPCEGLPGDVVIDVLDNEATEVDLVATVGVEL